MSPDSLLFVYGTLKRGCCNHRHLADQKFLGVARTAPGYRLFELGGYPGLVSHPADLEGVTGEVWSVDATALRRLDDFEGVAEGLYRREHLPLLAPFADAKVDAYVFAQSIAGRRDLGGTWVE